MGHPDFRVGGRIFATLGYPAGGWAVVMLAPEQQEAFCARGARRLRSRQGQVGRSRRD